MNRGPLNWGMRFEICEVEFVEKNWQDAEGPERPTHSNSSETRHQKLFMCIKDPYKPDGWSFFNREAGKPRVLDIAPRQTWYVKSSSIGLNNTCSCKESWKILRNT